MIAVNNLGYIGKDNNLMWRCSEDLKHFKRMTEGKRLLVGYNTYQELPDVVKQESKRNIYEAVTGSGRHIIIDERGDIGKQFDAKGYRKPYTNDFISVICIGGKKTYEKYANQFTELHISYINDNSVGDCAFPDLKNLNPECKIFKYQFEPNIKLPFSADFIDKFSDKADKIIKKIDDINMTNSIAGKI